MIVQAHLHVSFSTVFFIERVLLKRFYLYMKSLLNGMPNVPTCPTCITCPRALRALRALRVHVPKDILQTRKLKNGNF